MRHWVAKLVVQRILAAMLTLAIVSFVVFFATSLLPGDAATAMLGQAATPEAVAGLRKAMHLDEPAAYRFLHWVWNMLHGDLGISYVNDMPISTLVGGRLLQTIKLAGLTTAVALPLSLFLGTTAALMRGTAYDRFVVILTVGVVSVPEFMVATLAVLVFAVYLGWLPALSMVTASNSWASMLRAYAMPLVTLTFVVSAQMIRMTRAALIDTLATPYAEMAMLKGASRTRVVLRHALPNAVGPIANAAALSLAYLVGGMIIVETIFNFPGVAKLMVDGVETRDLPLIQSCAMLFCVAHLALTTLADIAAIAANPALR